MCDECRVLFASRRGAMQHLASAAHDSTQTRPVRLVEPDEQNQNDRQELGFVCRLCAKPRLFTRLDGLRRHSSALHGAAELAYAHVLPFADDKDSDTGKDSTSISTSISMSISKSIGGSSSGRARELASYETLLVPYEPAEPLPAFQGLAREQVVLASTASDARRAVSELHRLLGDPPYMVGFDTESKPTFVAGQRSCGPHVIQLALAGAAWLFLLGGAEDDAIMAELAPVLCSPAIAKYGFGLTSDRRLLRERFGLDTQDSLVDLGVLTRGFLPHVLGARTGAELLLGRSFAKSKSMGTKNWAARLTNAMVLYAANDAHLAFAVASRLGQLGDVPGLCAFVKAHREAGGGQLRLATV